tara:strand:+ start:1767 stop:2216 length:450 start_codon:yes stop_codon:yes gene_type:complete
MEEKQLKLIYSENYKDIILQEIANLYDIDNKDYICSNNRKQNLMYAKRLFVYILRTKFDLSLVEVGKIANLHHASIIHHVKAFEIFKNLKGYKEKEMYKIVEERIEQTQVDETIRILQKQSKEIDKKLKQLYNLKNRENVRNKRKNLCR